MNINPQLLDSIRRFRDLCEDFSNSPVTPYDEFMSKLEKMGVAGSKILASLGKFKSRQEFTDISFGVKSVHYIINDLRQKEAEELSEEELENYKRILTGYFSDMLSFFMNNKLLAQEQSA